MAELAPEIQVLCDRYARKLDELHDDYVHTRMLWRSLQVRVFRHKKKLTVHNSITNTVVNGVELASKAGSSVQRLMNRSFKDIVAQVELFVAELLRLWLHDDPSVLSEKAITVAVLLASPTLADAQRAAVQEAVESTIADKMYGRPDKWFNYLKKNLGAQFLVQDESSFIEMKARRDVLEHNNGIVEVTYREKAKAAAKFDLGSLVKLTEQDIDEAHHLIQRLITDAGVSVIARLKTP